MSDLTHSPVSNIYDEYFCFYKLPALPLLIMSCLSWVLVAGG